MARIITRKNLEEHKFMQHFSEDRKDILDAILFATRRFDSNNSVDLLKEINTELTLFNSYSDKHKLKASEMFRTKLDDAKKFMDVVLIYISQKEILSRCCKRCSKPYDELEK